MIQSVQKAITAALVPIVLALLAQLIEAIGVDIPVEPTAIEAIVAAVVSAVFVWLVPNNPPEEN